MKKTVITLAALMGLFAASCKKDYSCTCRWNQNSKDTAFAYSISDSKRGAAHDNCDAREATVRQQTGVSTAECEIGD